jgi:hypothetical protein
MERISLLFTLIKFLVFIRNADIIMKIMKTQIQKLNKTKLFRELLNKFIYI